MADCAWQTRLIRARLPAQAHSVLSAVPSVANSIKARSELLVTVQVLESQHLAAILRWFLCCHKPVCDRDPLIIAPRSALDREVAGDPIRLHDRRRTEQNRLATSRLVTPSG
jgi:hypothetical protein